MEDTRVIELGRYAAECELRAAKQEVDAIDAEALLDAASRYRQEQMAELTRIMREAVYPHANALGEGANVSEKPPVPGVFRGMLFGMAFMAILVVLGYLLYWAMFGR